MKRLRPAVLVVLILAANSVQAQTDAPRYRSSDATVYTDIVGELESSDDWIVQPDNEPEVFSQASIAQTSAPPLAPRLAPAAQNWRSSLLHRNVSTIGVAQKPGSCGTLRMGQKGKLGTTAGSDYSSVLTTFTLVEAPQQTISLPSTIWGRPSA